MMDGELSCLMSRS